MFKKGNTGYFQVKLFFLFLSNVNLLTLKTNRQNILLLILYQLQIVVQDQFYNMQTVSKINLYRL